MTNAPPRYASWEALVEGQRRREEQYRRSVEHLEPEPGIKAASWPVPESWGEPVERAYLPASPVLGLPYEWLEFRHEGRPVIIKRFQAPIAGYDDAHAAGR